MGFVTQAGRAVSRCPTCLRWRTLVLLLLWWWKKQLDRYSNYVATLMQARVKVKAKVK